MLYGLLITSFSCCYLNVVNKLLSVFNQIENLNIATSIDAIQLSWKPPKYADYCNIHYEIYASKEIPYYRYVNQTEHQIKNLQSCTEYKVSITPSSIVRNESGGEIFYSIEHTVSTCK